MAIHIGQRADVGREPTTDDGNVVNVALAHLCLAPFLFDSVPPLTRSLLCCPVELQLQFTVVWAVLLYFFLHDSFACLFGCRRARLLTAAGVTQSLQ